MPVAVPAMTRLTCDLRCDDVTGDVTGVRHDSQTQETMGPRAPGSVTTSHSIGGSAASLNAAP